MSNQTSHQYRLLPERSEVPMDALFALFIIVASLVGLDLATVAWGADSREAIGDDHVR